MTPSDIPAPERRFIERRYELAEQADVLFHNVEADMRKAQRARYIAETWLRIVFAVVVVGLLSLLSWKVINEVGEAAAHDRLVERDVLDAVIKEAVPASEAAALSAPQVTEAVYATLVSATAVQVGAIAWLIAKALFPSPKRED